MGSSLFGTLNNSLQAIQAFQEALSVSQNNVSNSSTPGYARQVVNLEALPFDPGNGSSGGVKAGPTTSTNDEYVNQAVRNQLSQQGNYTAQSSALSSVESLFDVSGQTGIVGALNNLFQSFSAWSATPGSASAQQQVLTSAQSLAQSFQSTAASLSQTTTQLNQNISSTVQQINQLATQIQSDNIAIQKNPNPSGGVDAGVSANLEASLESLSQLANITVNFASDGTATVLLGGQTPLVVGAQENSIQASFSTTTGSVNPNAIPNAVIQDSSGQDITANISGGSLGGLLTVRNTVLPSLQGNGTQTGALNQLAQQVADRVNQVLTSATTASGQAGVPLFSYNNTSPVDTASTLALSSTITASSLASVDPTQPAVGNGAALTLSNLGTSTNPADQIGGQTMLQFLSNLAAQVGQQASNAQTGQTAATQAVTQAQAVQTQISGVSLDAEAINVMELQQGYQAAGKMVSVVDSLAQTLMSMVGTA